MTTAFRSTNALPLTPKAQRGLIERLYATASLGARWKQSWRPYLAPFDRLLQHVPPGSSIMDIGCGGGLFLLLLAACGRIKEGFGFDLSPKSIGAARKAARDSGLQSILHFEVVDADASMPDAEWPVVSMIDVLHHVPKRRHRSLISSLPQYVSPGGRLIIREPVRRPYWRNLANMVHDLIMARQIVHARDPEEIEGWVYESGLRLVSKETSTALWYGYWLLVFERPN